MHDSRLTLPPQPLASAPGHRRSRPTRLRPTTVWVALAVCLSLVAGCGSDDKKKDTAAPDAGPAVTEFKGDPNKACELATKAEVEAALATKVKAGVGALGTVCTYVVENAFDQSVVLERTDSPESPQFFELSKSSPDAAVEPLPGVGDDAFIAGNKAYVLKGQVLAGITVTLKQPQPAVTAAIKKLAQAAAQHA